MTFLRENPVAAVIAAGEIAFWVFLLGGLAVRYLLRWRVASTALLIAVPLVDVVVLAATYLDLRAGGEANFTHGLAAVYLGFSVAFGHSMMRWADQRFAHRFAGGPPPWKPPKYGRAKVVREWREFGKFMIAWAISVAIILLFVVMFGDRAEPMETWLVRMSVVGGIWFVTGPLWYSLSPPKDPSEESRESSRTDASPDGATSRSAR